jgi:type I restriction enzyme S subunit
MKNLTQEAFLDISVGVPPRAEQLDIASHLDTETSRIDSLLVKKRDLIERLKEKRMALISRTVTRGLPPIVARIVGFSENPVLRHSGIDWLGQIPAHWKVTQLKWAIMFPGCCSQVAVFLTGSVGRCAARARHGDMR